MAKVQWRHEVMFKAPTRIGLLADVTEALNAVGVNIQAIGAYDKGDMGEFLLITDDNQRALDALATLDGEAGMQSVVVAEVPNKPGELAAISRVLAEHDINVGQIYSSSAGGAEKVLIVIRAESEADILQLLEHL